jgi:eukaryotic-like serine/threonine-protein kinase
MGSQQNAPLPAGLEIGGYRILKKIASGGFSIVYLAQDEVGELYAVKEYLPASLVKRASGELVPAVNADQLTTFRNGLKCFFEEGRALARISHPNVVRVTNFFRANETVYMVMGYEKGRTLQDIILRYRGKATKGNREVVPEKHVRRIFTQAMNGLREVHANRLLHLDIKPANLYLRLDGSPMLLDFGAARQSLTGDNHRLFPMYTPGFAPPELYKRNQEFGPWTDIYSLGASMFAAIIGAPPQPADQRLTNDRTNTILESALKSYSHELIHLINWCLRLNPLERPQSVFALQRTMRRIHPDSAGDAHRSTIAKWFDTVTDTVSAKRSSGLTSLARGNTAPLSIPTR